MSARPLGGKKKKAHPAARRRPPRQRPRNLRAEYKRAARPSFARLFSLLELRALPLPLGCPLELPPSPKTRFRSWYRPRTAGAIRRLLAHWKAHPPTAPPLFRLALFLIDFSPLRPLLLHLTVQPSARGEHPFDPLSLLLACLWKVADGQPWTTTASSLADPQNNALWRRLCGFTRHDTPSEAALRAFRDRLSDGLLNYIQKLFLLALDRLGLLPTPDQNHGYLLVGDGQRHHARSRQRCYHAVATCYQPTTPQAPRPCPAWEESQGQVGCDCATPACQSRCALAPHLDRQARYSVYDRHKEGPTDTPTAAEQHPPDAVFGYRSLASRLVDTRFHTAWNVYSDCLPANADEGACFPAHMAATHANLPRQEVGYVVYDAACGEQPAMDAVYDCGGIPLFAINRAPGDQDSAKCQERGYDQHGHLLCHLGFPMTCQGIDRSRKQPRARWVCQQACRSEGQEVPDCPYLSHHRGQYRYLERAFPDGSYRLARLVPYGTPAWKKLTAWRNTSEGRNGSLESRGLKRFPDYGLRHGTFLVIAADLVENLCTLARLIYEATLQDERFQAWDVRTPRPRIVVRTSSSGSAEPTLEREMVGGG